MNKILLSKNPPLAIFLHISVLFAVCLCAAACIAEYTSGMVHPPLFFLLSPPLLNLIDSEAIDYK